MQTTVKFVGSVLGLLDRPTLAGLTLLASSPWQALSKSLLQKTAECSFIFLPSDALSTILICHYPKESEPLQTERVLVTSRRDEFAKPFKAVPNTADTQKMLIKLAKSSRSLTLQNFQISRKNVKFVSQLVGMQLKILKLHKVTYEDPDLFDRFLTKAVAKTRPAVTILASTVLPSSFGRVIEELYKKDALEGTFPQPITVDLSVIHRLVTLYKKDPKPLRLPLRDTLPTDQGIPGFQDFNVASELERIVYQKTLKVGEVKVERMVKDSVIVVTFI
ncbi:hypothetical protein QR680_013633 [Steinernema hermaphroditum]|uniref:Uncharacterized protein n=1 Tax=Steinernema hermaphroditum TaxID=289476 RepID=A0AA39I658_9BILA|nr:hypothetical protein QR680_013633 [Steinernema hermaphroditum]